MKTHDFKPRKLTFDNVMRTNSPIAQKILCLVVLVVMALFPPLQAQLIIHADYDFDVGSLITIQEESNLGAELRVYETSGLVLKDRIEFRFSADLFFESKKDPAGWSYQESSLTENGEDFRQISYFYTGMDPNNNGEFINFSPDLKFQFDLSRDDPSHPESAALDINVFATALVPGYGGVAVTQSEITAIPVTAVPEMEQLQFVTGLLLGCLLLSRQRRKATMPGRGFRN